MTYVALMLSIVLLLASPLAEKILEQRWHKLHRFLMAALAIVVCVGAAGHIWLKIFKIIGLWALPFVALGIFFVWLSERLWIENRFGSKLSLVVAVVGVIIHSLTDGAVIAFSGNFSDAPVALLTLVVVHQVPVGIFLWSQTRRRLGDGRAWITPIGMSLAIIAGFLFAQSIALTLLGSFSFAAFEAFFLGSLIHIALDPFLHGRKTSCHCDESPVGADSEERMDADIPRLKQELELLRRECGTPQPGAPQGNTENPRLVLVDDMEFIREAWLHQVGKESICCFASPFDLLDHALKHPDFLQKTPTIFVDFDYGFGTAITGKHVASFLKRIYRGRIVLYSEMDISDWPRWFDRRVEKKIFSLDELVAQGL